MGRWCATRHRRPAADASATGGPERRRFGAHLVRRRPASARVLRAPQRRRCGVGGNDGQRRVPPPPASVSGRQRGGAPYGSRHVVLLLGVPLALPQLLPAGVPSRLLATGQEKARGRERRRAVLAVPGEEEQKRARAGEREEGAGADGSERAPQSRDRAIGRGGAEDAPGAHRETRQHQEVKEQQERRG